METNSADKRWRFTEHLTKRYRAQAIPYGSYTENVAISTLVLIGLAAAAATAVSIFVALAIL